MSDVSRRLLVAGLLLVCLAATASYASNYQIVPLVPPTGEVKGAVDPRARPYAYPPGLETPDVPFGQGLVGEVEPNGTSATATPLGGTSVAAKGNIFPNGDVDFWSFPAAAGDRVYAATMTSFSANASTDSQLRLFASDGTTLIEFDDDDGAIGGLSSSIAGAIIPAAGTYFLEVRHFSATNQLRPYYLQLRVQSGAPTPEVESNDTPATANPLPANGWVSGTRNPAVATEQDWYSFTAAAGDTVWVSLDLDPENDVTTWNGRLGIALFGDVGNQILVVDDSGAVDTSDSESHFMTIKTPGTYYAFVDSASAATGGPTATYHLSVTIRPAVDEGVNCTVYTSTDVPKTIGPGAGLVSSVLTVPGNPRIADVDVQVVLNHAVMTEIDAHLRSPAGNDNGLFTDIGAAATGGQTMMDTTFDDEAGMPPLFTAMRNMSWTPELAYRLGWFDGEDAGGTWTLDLRDDTGNTNGGTLTAWSLRICEPAPPAACAPGFAPQTVFATDFEANDGGFTHSGVQDEWERGLPTFAPLTTCASGVNCWKTDLDNTYNASANQVLLSPAINLAGLSAPVTVRWAQRYQMENATFDLFSVDFQQAGGATPVRLFEWYDATMTDAIGSPLVTIQESSGWSQFVRRADSLAGLNTELEFSVLTDTTVQLAGVAIDDVSVTACRPLASDISVTKADGVTTAVPGGSTTYTITVVNGGPDPATGVAVVDTFPAACLTHSFTSVAVGGASGNTLGPSPNDINDVLAMPSGSSVTYTATCNIDPAATGSLVNTATATVTGDPDPTDNSATDTDTLTPQTDIAVTKDDGTATAVPGGTTTYTIVVTNNGPSNATGVAVSDPVPVGCTIVNYTSVAAGGATGNTAAGSGAIADSLTMPAASSVTYTATCSISPGATGTLTNTASATVATDPNNANNSATDTDALTPQADLAISKTDGLATANLGDPITYTITVTNTGPSDAPGATVADTFPAGYTVTGWTCSGSGGGTCTGAGAGNINDIVNLPAGGSVVYTVNGSANAIGVLSNTATVTAPAGVTDGNPANNSATDDTTITSAASVSGTKTVTGDFSEGGTIFYTVVLTNAGPGTQLDNPGDEFTDVLPGSLTLVTVSATSGTASFVGNTASWNGSIAASASVTITIEAVINPGTAGTTISNQGTVFFDADGNGDNESQAPTDDPAIPGATDPTDFEVGLNPSVLEIPTLSPAGIAALAIVLAALSLLLLRRRRAG